MANLSNHINHSTAGGETEYIKIIETNRLKCSKESVERRRKETERILSNGRFGGSSQRDSVPPIRHESSGTRETNELTVPHRQRTPFSFETRESAKVVWKKLTKMRNHRVREREKKIMKTKLPKAQTPPTHRCLIPSPP